MLPVTPIDGCLRRTAASSWHTSITPLPALFEGIGHSVVQAHGSTLIPGSGPHVGINHRGHIRYEALMERRLIVRKRDMGLFPQGFSRSE